MKSYPHRCSGDDCPRCQAEIDRIEEERLYPTDPEYDALMADGAAADMVYKEPE